MWQKIFQTCDNSDLVFNFCKKVIYFRDFIITDDKYKKYFTKCLPITDGKKSFFDISATLIKNLLISNNKVDDKLSEDFFHLFGRD